MKVDRVPTGVFSKYIVLAYRPVRRKVLQSVQPDAYNTKSAMDGILTI